MLYHYFVEGECEMNLIKSFMHTDKYEYRIKPGKVTVLNVLNQKISPARAMTLKRDTIVVFIYDTDVNKTNILEDNIDTLHKYSGVKEIIYLQSNKKLEDELLRCCDIKNINDLLGTKGINEFKNKFSNHKNIVSKLLNVGFDLTKMWSLIPEEPFDIYIKAI